MTPFSVRVATADDLQVTYAITEDAMRGYVAETWGSWDVEYHMRQHAENFAPGKDKVILVGNEVVGFVAVEEFPSHVWLVKIYILQIFRGQGIGSQVLQGILKDAKARGKPVKLRVLRVNKRAKELYARNGFRVTEEDPIRLHMASGA